MHAEHWALGIDVGGTYVDAVAHSSAGRLVTLKHARDGEPIEDAVLAAVDRLLAEQSIAREQVARIVHGSTVVVNQLLELDAPPVGVIATRGTADVLELARQSRQDLYAAFVPPPTPAAQLFPAALRHGIAGRLDARGQEVEPLDEAEIDHIAWRLEGAGVQAVAVGLLFSHLDGAHERRVRERLLARKPDWAVSISSEVDGRPREFERFFATALDAFVKPRTAGYLSALAAALAARGLPAPSLMRSEGGLAPWREGAAKPLSLVLSGPTAALAGVALGVFAQDDRQDHTQDHTQEDTPPCLLTLDVGGTSTDIGLIEQGQPVLGERVQAGALDIRLAACDIESVAVGGGSVARVLEGGALRLGPRSQGAWPGPAAYGRGGEHATLTDALVVLGRLPGELAGGLVLDAQAAHDALRRDVAQPLGLDLAAAARAVVRAAAAAMAETLRSRAFQRGLDPADTWLVAAGGGGAQHAAEVAELAGIGCVRVPAHAGVIAALGLLAAREEQVAERPLACELDDDGIARLAAARRALGPDTAPGGVRERLWLRYRGQQESIEIAWRPGESVAELTARFHARHARLRGQSQPDQRIELTRVAAVFVQGPGVASVNAAPAAASREVRQEVRQEIRQEVWPDAQLARGAVCVGPSCIAGASTTVWVPPGWRCHRLADDSLLLTQASA